MKRLIAAALALVAFLPALPAQAESGTLGRIEFPLVFDDDLDAAAYRYCHTQSVPIATPGNSTRAEGVLNTPGREQKTRITITAGAAAPVTAGTEPFGGLSVGDYIYIQQTGVETPDTLGTVEGEQWVWLKVTVVTNANSITVSPALTITNRPFFWRRGLCRSANGYGWVPVSAFDQVKFNFSIVQANTTTGIDVRVECRDNTVGIDTSSIRVVYPYDGATCGFGTLSTDTCTFTATSGPTAALPIIIDTKTWYECRLGYRLNTTDDGDDLTTNMEQIRVDFVGVYSK
jgi:hypothetical protein